MQTGIFDRLHIDDIAEVVDVRGDVVVRHRCRGDKRSLIGEAFDSLQVLVQIAVGLVGDRRGDISVGRAAVGRVVFDTTVIWRVVGRGDDNPISELFLPAVIVSEDGVGDDRRGGIFKILGDAHLDAIGC